MKKNILVLSFLLVVFSRFNYCKTCAKSSMLEYDCKHLSLIDVPWQKFEQVFKMDLSYNQIRTLRNDTFLERDLLDLGILLLQDNKITTIDVNAFRGMSDLDFLNLNNNDIEEIPADLFKSNLKLRYLRFENNTHLQLPKVGFRLPELNILDLEQCGLETIPSNFFANMRDLEQLYLRKNKLQFLDPELIRPLIELEFLDLRDNLFTKLQVNILRLPLIFETSYSGNPLQCDCNLVRAYSLYKKKAISGYLNCKYEEKNITAVSIFQTQINCSLPSSFSTSNDTASDQDFDSSLQDPNVFDISHQNELSGKLCHGKNKRSWFANHQGLFITIIVLFSSLLLVIAGLIIFRHKNFNSDLIANRFRELKNNHDNVDNDSLEGNDAI